MKEAIKSILLDYQETELGEEKGTVPFFPTGNKKAPFITGPWGWATRSLVEAAGVEPASGNLQLQLLHA
jgi:hypothetical protein